MLNKNGEQVSGGVFLIGLALLFLTGWWWPGILFVIGASMMSRTVAENKSISHATPGIGFIVAGLVFWVGFSINWGLLVPFLLIAAGAWMLFGGGSKVGDWRTSRLSDWRASDEDDDSLPKSKRKNDSINA
jgi:hypothetical protein